MPVSLFTDGIEPEDLNADIWRFMDLRKFSDLLTGQMYFRRADLFTDRSEGLPPEEYEHVLNLNRYDLKDVRERNNSIGFIAQMRQSYYISCWYLFGEETAAMWKTYGENGVAVRSTYNRLKSVLNVLPDDAMLGLVRYGAEHLTRWNLMQFISTKQKQYEHEKEVRAMLWIRDPNESGNRHIDRDNCIHEQPVYPTPNPEGIKRAVDLATLISEVIVSPYARPTRLAGVRRAVRDSGQAFPATPSDLTRFAAFLL